MWNAVMARPIVDEAPHADVTLAEFRALRNRKRKRARSDLL